MVEIPEKENKETYWFDEYDTEDDVRDALVQIEESITEDDVRNIAGATEFDALVENNEFIATYYSTWDAFFADEGIDDSEVQSRVRSIHQSEAVYQLDMDRGQPVWMLITEKN